MEEQDNVSVNPSVETSEASCSDTEDVSSDTEDDSSDTEDDSSDDCPEVSGLWTQYCDQSTRQQESDDEEKCQEDEEKCNEEPADLHWVERKQLYYSETLQKYYVRRPWLVEVKPDSSDTEQQTSSEECSDSDVDSDVQSNVESESGLMSNDFDQKIFEYYQAIREREIERKREKKSFKLRLPKFLCQHPTV